MMSNNLKSEFYNVLANVFKVDIDSLKDEMTKDDIDKWDSMQQLILIMDLEAKFGIRFETDDVFDIDTIGSILNILNKKLS